VLSVGEEGVTIEDCVASVSDGTASFADVNLVPGASTTTEALYLFFCLKMQLTHFGVAVSADQQTEHSVTPVPTPGWPNHPGIIGEESSKEAAADKRHRRELIGFAPETSLVLGHAGTCRRPVCLARTINGPSRWRLTEHFSAA